MTVKVRTVYIDVAIDGVPTLTRRSPQPGTVWNGEIRTCVITEVSRGLPNNASMFATEVILFVVILCGVYQRNSGRRILSTMYREVRETGCAGLDLGPRS